MSDPLRGFATCYVVRVRAAEGPMRNHCPVCYEET